jgi:hypothetical protein
MTLKHTSIIGVLFNFMKSLSKYFGYVQFVYYNLQISCFRDPNYDLDVTFRVQCVGVFITSFSSKSHVRNWSGSLVSAIEPKTKDNFKHSHHVPILRA